MSIHKPHGTKEEAGWEEVEDENPCTSPAWLGYSIDPGTQEFIWSVCAWCPPVAKEPIEREAERLCIRVSHGMCEACATRMRGELLPGI